MSPCLMVTESNIYGLMFGPVPFEKREANNHDHPEHECPQTVIVLNLQAWQVLSERHRKNDTENRGGVDAQSASKTPFR